MYHSDILTQCKVSMVQQKYSRVCPSCGKTVYHVNKGAVTESIKNNALCRTCHIKKRSETGSYSPKEKYSCLICGVEFFNWKSQISNPDTPFCSKKCWYKSNLKSLVNKRFGRLLVLERTRNTEKKTTFYQCQCDCGNITRVSHSGLTCSNIQSCGCLQKEQLVARSKKEPGYAIRTSILNVYKHNAKVAEREFSLSREEFEALIFLPCKYCGIIAGNITKCGKEILHHNGIDRIDSDLGYVKENCVACCKRCNQAKTDSKLEDFITWIKKVALNVEYIGTSVELKEDVSPKLIWVEPAENTVRKNHASRKPEKSLPRALLWYYKRNAKNRDIEFLLSQEEFKSLIFDCCHYCTAIDSMLVFTKYGAAYKHNGVDRVDNTKGYTVENCVSCCKRCNMAKNNMTLEEFKEWIVRVSEHITKEKL